jgi:hypothetical protein
MLRAMLSSLTGDAGSGTHYARRFPSRCLLQTGRHYNRLAARNLARPRQVGQPLPACGERSDRLGDAKHRPERSG